MRDLSAANAEAFLEMMSAERGAADNTLDAYRRDLDDASAVLKSLGTSLARAKAEDIRGVIGDLAARGFSPASQARRLSALRQFYKFLHAEGLRDDDPTGVVATHVQHRMHEQMRRDVVLLEHDPDRVDEERCIVADDHHERAVGVPAVAVAVRREHRDGDVAG